MPKSPDNGTIERGQGKEKDAKTQQTIALTDWCKMDKMSGTITPDRGRLKELRRDFPDAVPDLRPREYVFLDGEQARVRLYYEGSGSEDLVAVFEGADLSDARLEGAYFGQVGITAPNFNRADLRRAHLNNIVIKADDSPYLNNVNFTGRRFNAGKNH